MAQFKKSYCLLVAVYISGVLSKDLKKPVQVSSVYNPDNLLTIQKTNQLQHLKSDEIKKTHLLDSHQVLNPRKQPCPEKIKESESLAAVDKAFKHSVMNIQEHNFDYSHPNEISHFNDSIVSEANIISTVVYPKQISDSSSSSSVDKAPKPIKPIDPDDKTSNQITSIRSLGESSRDISYLALSKRSYRDREKGIPNLITDRDTDICSTDLPPLSPTSKSNIIRDAKRFARLAGAAYFNHADLKEWDCTHCLKAGKYKLIKTIKVPALNLQCIILVDKERRDLVFSFRGSKNIKQVKELISVAKEPYKLYKSAKVQTKLEERTKAIFKKMSEFLKPIINYYWCYRKVLVGHSLGGAMAVLAAPRIGKKFGIPYDDIAVYTYGQPRVGDKAFAKWYNKLKIHTIRVVNGRDSVPHLPQAIFGFSHTHRELFLEKSETLCSTSSLDDKKCSNKYWFLISMPRTHRQVWDIEI